jgi:hypothetical protein
MHECLRRPRRPPVDVQTCLLSVHRLRTADLDGVRRSACPVVHTARRRDVPCSVHGSRQQRHLRVRVPSRHG